MAAPAKARRESDTLEEIRTPPHSVEAEQALLGGLLLDSVAWENVAHVVRASEADWLREWASCSNSSNDEFEKVEFEVRFGDLDIADRIYWYSLTGNSWFFAGGAGISSTPLTGAK